MNEERKTPHDTYSWNMIGCMDNSTMCFVLNKMVKLPLKIALAIANRRPPVVEECMLIIIVYTTWDAECEEGYLLQGIDDKWMLKSTVSQRFFFQCFFLH